MEIVFTEHLSGNFSMLDLSNKLDIWSQTA